MALTITGKNGQPDMNDAEAISKHFLASEDHQWVDTVSIFIVIWHENVANVDQFTTNVAGQYFMSSM